MITTVDLAQLFIGNPEQFERLRFIGTLAMSVYTITNKNQEIKFCCQGCEKTFNKNPEKYLKKLKEEVAKLEKESKK